MRLFVQRRRQQYLLLLAALATALFSAERASADPFYVRAGTRVQTSGFGISDPQYNNDDTGQVTALSVSSGPFTVTSSEANYATATAYVQSDLGALHGYANFAASTANAPAGASAEGTASSWGDTITITSDTLPIGTPVTLEATLTFHRDIEANRVHDNNILIQTSSSASFGLYISDSYYFPDPTQSQSTLVTFLRVGDTYQISGSLNFQAAGTAWYDDSGLTGSIDISNTAVFNLLSLTPGASYTTASGVSYVPEPTSFALAGTGLFLLGMGRVRRHLAGRRKTAQV